MHINAAVVITMELLDNYNQTSNDSSKNNHNNNYNNNHRRINNSNKIKKTCIAAMDNSKIMHW